MESLGLDKYLFAAKVELAKSVDRDKYKKLDQWSWSMEFVLKTKTNNKIAKWYSMFWVQALWIQTVHYRLSHALLQIWGVQQSWNTL